MVIVCEKIKAHDMSGPVGMTEEFKKLFLRYNIAS